MKQIKKVMIIFLCILCFIFSTKLLWNVLNEAGYIPFNEEYDRRIYKKNYKKCEEDFECLIEEINLYKENISKDIKEEYSNIFFSPQKNEWIVDFFQDDQHVMQKSEKIVNTDSITEIENRYNDLLLTIIYRKEENLYVFRIGEYYRITVSEEGVTVE